MLPGVEWIGGHTVDEPVQGGQGVDQPPAHTNGFIADRIKGL